jgi:tetratricopeptide (TPR) repeat protein
MMGKLKYFSAFLLVFITLSVQSQNHGSDSRRAARHYERALKDYSLRNYDQALQSIQKAFAIDEQFTKAYLFGGDIAMDLENDSLAIVYYQKAIAIAPDFYPPAHYILGNLYYQNGMYAAAYERFKHYLTYNLPEKEQELTKNRKSGVAAALELKNNPVPFNPVNLNYRINTSNDEYVNAISADGSMLIFTLRSPVVDDFSRNILREEFYVSYFEDGEWLKARPMTFLSGKSESEGALALSYDNQYIFFTSCHQPDGYGSCDLYYSRKMGDDWLEPQNLGPIVNSARWESQPSLSSDGRTLYFASNRPGGVGGSDLWKTVLMGDNRWSPPVNLGETINTPGDEMSPYMHADGKTLYFSSKGHPGLGGADLFMSRLQTGNCWSEPLNLGYPINTEADEINLIVDPDGLRAYISSDLPQGKGGYDIYMFELHEAIKPMPVSYLKGIVRDANTLNPLKANIELTELINGQIVVQSWSDAVNGEFITVLPVGSNYALNVNRKGYLFYSHHFALDSVTGFFNPVLLDIFLKPIEAGQTAILKNVFFALDSYQLQETSQVELSRLVDFLTENTEIGLEISGHTDNTGLKAYNKVLSTNRAKAVFEFLINAGIDENRLSFVGKADEEPIDTNSTPEGRANNRRTEFKIVNK